MGELGLPTNLRDKTNGLHIGPIWVKRRKMTFNSGGRSINSRLLSLNCYLEYMAIDVALTEIAWKALMATSI